MATRYDPLTETARLMDQMLGTMREASTTSVPSMAMDLFRSGDHYVMCVDLPGVDPGSIDVNVEDRTLTIRAQRSSHEDAGVQWLARERATGTYVRQLNLGRGLAFDRIEAGYADGVLTLTIPVAEEAKPRRIEIQQGSPRQAALDARRERAAVST